jgi:serine/threonine protein kinase
MAEISQRVEGAAAVLATRLESMMTFRTFRTLRTFRSNRTNRAIDLGWAIPGPGDRVAGKYVVEAQCGRGGLAVILSAVHAELDRRVALKILLPEWASDAEMVERFLREGRTSTRIQSEHVVGVFDVGTLEGGAPYLVLEYLEGSNLEDVVAKWGPIAIPTAVDWVLQAAEAIAEAHELGIVHRDLKPANLFLTRRADGSACIKVIDFGLSKLTNPRLRIGSKNTLPTDVMGSPHYMAPEQLRAACDADERSDIWALGAVLHELVAGQPPFGGQSVPEICATVLTQPPVRISAVRSNVPQGLERAVLRCLEKNPDARYSTVLELAVAIAPYGTPLAQASLERIGRMAERPTTAAGVREDEITLLPPLPDDYATRVSWPNDDSSNDFMRRIPQGTAPSARVVLGSLFMLAGLGAAILMFMYDSVHADDGRHAGAAAMQPVRAQPPRTATAETGAPLQPATPAPPAPPPPTATLVEAATATPGHALPDPAPRPRATTPPRTPDRTASTSRAPVTKRAAVVPTVPRVPAPQVPAPRAAPPEPPARPSDLPTRAPAGDDLFDGRK